MKPIRHVLKLRVEVDTVTAIDALRKCADALGAVAEVHEVVLCNPSDFNVPVLPTDPTYSDDQEARP